VLRGPHPAAASSQRCLADLRQNLQTIRSGRNPQILQENVPFLSFPYVCPEPVLVK
jgi:hypothetical protein